MSIIDDIKTIRRTTGVGLRKAHKTYIEFNNNVNDAIKYLKKYSGEYDINLIDNLGNLLKSHFKLPDHTQFQLEKGIPIFIINIVNRDGYEDIYIKIQSYSTSFELGVPFNDYIFKLHITSNNKNDIETLLFNKYKKYDEFNIYEIGEIVHMLLYDNYII